MKKSSVVTYVITLTIATVLFYSPHSKAQSSLIGTLPMQFNPAFAGAAGAPRIGINTNLLSVDLGPSKGNNIYKERKLSFSYDNFLPKIASGIGFRGDYRRLINSGFVSRESETMDALRLGISLAPKFSFKGKYTLSPAVEVIANLKNTNYKHFSQKSELVNTSFSPEVRFGLNFNARKFYMGFSYHTPVPFRNYQRGRSFGVDEVVRISSSPRWYLQMGYNFQKREDSKFSFSPQIVYGRFRDYVYYGNQNYLRSHSDMLLNLIFRYKQIVWGITLGDYDGIKLMAGWQKKNFRIAYLQGASSRGFNGQISFRYIFNTPKTSNVNLDSHY